MANIERDPQRSAMGWTNPSRRSILRGLTAAAAASMALACGLPAHAQSDKPVKIGALLGLSGLGSQIGQWILNGDRKSTRLNSSHW